MVLLEVGADVDWTDAAAGAAAQTRVPPGAGRLADAVEWLAATLGNATIRRARCLVVGSVPDRVAELATVLEAGVQPIPSPSEAGDGVAAGVAAADAEIDAGADLLIVAGRDDTVAPALAVSVLTGSEPVALLPRGAAATPSAPWIERAATLRDARRRVVGVRGRPDELITALGSPTLAVLTGLALRAAARRTATVLDGTAATAAGLLGQDVQARAVRWWQLADRSPDAVHTRAAEELGRRPLLDLNTELDDGTAGLLALAMLRAALGTAGAADD
jgi:nicotinate-nucleotide--dimethylbenzimidazole phosphoribosyltransferase